MSKDTKRKLVYTIIAVIWIVFLALCVMGVVTLSNSAKAFRNAKEALDKLPENQMLKERFEEAKSIYIEAIFMYIIRTIFDLCIAIGVTIALKKFVDNMNLKQEIIESINDRITKLETQNIVIEKQSKNVATISNLDLLSSMIINNGIKYNLAFVKTNLALAEGDNDIMTTMLSGEFLQLVIENDSIVILNSKSVGIGKISNSEVKEKIKRHIKDGLPIVARFESSETKTIAIGLYDCN